MTTQKRSKEDVLKECLNTGKGLTFIQFHNALGNTKESIYRAMEEYASQFIQEIEYWKQRLSDCENMNQMSGREGGIK